MTEHTETLIDQLTDDAARVMVGIDAATGAFADASGIACRQRCGQCCLAPTIEARVVEFLPLARHLLATGEAEAIHARARAAPNRACVLYRPEADDPTLGRCGFYTYRPSTCRLFGYAAVRRKDGRRELAACGRHKQLQPATVAAAQHGIDAGGDVPLYTDYSMQLGALSAAASLSTLLPINEAIAVAIEKAALAQPTAWGPAPLATATTDESAISSPAELLSHSTGSQSIESKSIELQTLQPLSGCGASNDGVNRR